MNVVLWILAILLGGAFIAAGILKVLRTKEQLVASGLAWTEDFSANQVKAIGAIEALGGIGLILPALVNIAPILVPIAATGLAIAMALAVVVHVRRGEISGTLPAAVLLILSVIVAWGRFGPYSF
jgi:hypothetical protein